MTVATLSTGNDQFLSQANEVIAAARAAAGTANVTEPDGSIGNGPLLTCGAFVRPIEVVVLALSG